MFPTKDKEDEGTSVEFIKVSSLIDLARCAIQGSGFAPLYSFENGGTYRLFSMGERLEKRGIIYYFDQDSVSRYLIYSASDIETVSWSNSISEVVDPRAYKLHVITLDGNPFPERKGDEKINLVKVSDYGDLIKLLVYKGIEEDVIQNAYVFEFAGKTVIGGFDVVKGDDAHSFAYAGLEIEKPFNFFRYNYTEDKPETTEMLLQGSADFYVKVVHLDEAFGFLNDKKPE